MKSSSQDDNRKSTSVIIVTYNHGNYIEPCISSFIDDKFLKEIIVVDNGSHDKTCLLIEAKFPMVKLIKHKNVGYGTSNNIGIKQAKGKYIIVMNPDTIAEHNFIEELILPLKDDRKIITTPKILKYNGKKINTCGNIDHFTGLAFTRGLDEKSDNYNRSEYVVGFSGCCFAINNKHISDLLFDESFFMYMEDVELSWRAHARGYKILYIPSSKIHHDYHLNMNSKKLFQLESGRYKILKKYLSLRDIILILPSLLLVEIITFRYASKLGVSGFKMKSLALGTVMNKQIVKFSYSENPLKHLSYSIPLNNLGTNALERNFLSLCNYLFKLNMRLFN